MEWFSIYGAALVAVILTPNIVFAATHKDGFENLYQNKSVETIEQIGRFGSFILMFIQIPPLCAGFWFPEAKTLYLCFGFGLAALYCLGWIVFWKENSVRKSLALSVLPSAMFLVCGAFSGNLPLLAAAVIFAPAHILISYKNAVLSRY